MRYAVFTASMPESSPTQVLTELVDCGYDGVEWRIVNDTGNIARPGFWSGNRSTLQVDWPLATFADWADQTHKAGLLVPNLGTYVQADDLAGVEKMMTVARAFAAPSLRVVVSNYTGDQSYDALLIKNRSQLAGVVALAAQFEVKVLVEMHHGTIIPSASAARRLVDGFDPKHLGVIYDSGNVVREGFENPRMALEILGPYLGHVHVKNAIATSKQLDGPQTQAWSFTWAPLHLGMCDLSRFYQALRAVGYDGWITVEDFSTDAPEVQRIRDALTVLREVEAAVCV